MDKSKNVDKIEKCGQNRKLWTNWKIWTKLKNMDKIEKYGQNWKLWTNWKIWTKLKNLDKIEKYGQNWKIWTKQLFWSCPKIWYFCLLWSCLTCICCPFVCHPDKWHFAFFPILMMLLQNYSDFWRVPYLLPISINRGRVLLDIWK